MGEQCDRAAQSPRSADEGCWAPAGSLPVTCAAPADSCNAVRYCIAATVSLPTLPCCSQDSYQPAEVGEGLWIVPVWSQPPNPAATNIVLEPGGRRASACSMLLCCLLAGCFSICCKLQAFPEWRQCPTVQPTRLPARPPPYSLTPPPLSNQTRRPGVWNRRPPYHPPVPALAARPAAARQPCWRDSDGLWRWVGGAGGGGAAVGR